MRRNAILRSAWLVCFFLAVWLCLNPTPASAQIPVGPHPAVERFFCEEVLEVSLDIGTVTDLRGMTLTWDSIPRSSSSSRVLAGTS